MKIITITCAAAVATTIVGGCHSGSHGADVVAHFDYFEYQGHDQRFDIYFDSASQYLNPILSGFYPDPSITRKGDTYYLTTSTFSTYPAMPLFVSHDLVHWRQISHILDRPSQQHLDSLDVNSGMYAPDLKYNPRNDTFYMINRNMGTGETFLVKSRDPEKGWSEPILLKDGGMDPSLFFDDDGSAYMLYNTDPDTTPRYHDEKAIAMYRFSVEGDSLVGEKVQLIRTGSRCFADDEDPVWLEGPHMYKINGYYYLMCAQGGTAEGHSEVIFRSRSPFGPWEDNPNNPILTQRDLPLDTTNPDLVTSTGHADLVQTPQGDWYAVFLGCRPYGNGKTYNTGRETFLLPVSWKDGWPTILPAGQRVPTVVNKPGLASADLPEPTTGNIHFRDDFRDTIPSLRWITLRHPLDSLATTASGLDLQAVDADIYGRELVSALFTRQKNTNFTAQTKLTFDPRTPRQLAGLVLYQNENYNIVMGKTIAEGSPALVLERVAGHGTREVLKKVPLSTDGPLTLRMHCHGGRLACSYSENNGDTWLTLANDVDATNLSTLRAGGFIGTLIGLYATK